MRFFPPGLSRGRSLANELKPERTAGNNNKKVQNLGNPGSKARSAEAIDFFFFFKKIKPHCFSISKAIVSMCAFLFSRDEPQKISLLLMGAVQIQEEREVLGRVKDAGLQHGAHLQHV